MLGLSPHPGVSYLFQNQTSASVADDTLWTVALGSTALGNHIGASVLNSPPPSWTPALGELVLKVDGKFKVRKKSLFPLCRAIRLILFCLFARRKSFRCSSRTSTCSRGTASRTSSPRSIRSSVMLVGGVARRERTNSTRREPRVGWVGICIIGGHSVGGT
jgi:hypothetical protein